jgi:TrpR family transcriptional regulator, trp operon repressor
MHTESSEDGWRLFLELTAKFKETHELSELFDLFFTLEEKQDLAKRYSLIKALLGGRITQREIAEKLGISISKITRGSNALKIINSRLEGALKEHM